MNTYIPNILGQIKQSISAGNYFSAGRKLTELARVGVVVEDKFIVTICTELSDVFRNSFSDVESFKDKYGGDTVEKTIEKAITLLDTLENYSGQIKEDKSKILDLMMDVIFYAEKIQYFTRDTRIRKSEIIRRGLL
jgi:hypothetical protein